MKKMIAFLVIIILLAGCGVKDNSSFDGTSRMIDDEEMESETNSVLENDGEMTFEKVDVFIPDYMPEEKNTYGISNSNLSAGGYLGRSIMTEQGEYIYFIFKNSIYKYKEGGQPIQILSSDEYLHGINICGDYIYYTEGSYELSASNLGQIKRVRTDGEEIETLVDGVAADEILVVNNVAENIIYYVGITYNNSSNSSLCLFKYDMKKNESEKLISFSANECSILGVNQDTQIVYWGEKYKGNNENFWNIGCYDISTSQYETFFEEPNEKIGDIFVAGNKLIVDEFGWMQYIGVIDSNKRTVECEQLLDPNYRGIILADNENIIVRQSLDIWLVNIQNMMRVIPNNSSNFNLSEVPEAIKLVENDNGTNCGIAKGWFYYMPDEETICRVKVDGSDWEFFMQ